MAVADALGRRPGDPGLESLADEVTLIVAGALAPLIRERAPGQVG